jgi:hypothetical protein
LSPKDPVILHQLHVTTVAPLLFVSPDGPSFLTPLALMDLEDESWIGLKKFIEVIDSFTVNKRKVDPYAAHQSLPVTSAR